MNGSRAVGSPNVQDISGGMVHGSMVDGAGSGTRGRGSIGAIVTAIIMTGMKRIETTIMVVTGIETDRRNLSQCSCGMHHSFLRRNNSSL